MINWLKFSTQSAEIQRCLGIPEMLKKQGAWRLNFLKIKLYLEQEYITLASHFLIGGEELNVA